VVLVVLLEAKLVAPAEQVLLVVLAQVALAVAAVLQSQPLLTQVQAVVLAVQD
jgi:hypothetical protein